MAKADADIVAALRNELFSSAEINGYDLNSGTWIHNQVVCPDAPRHLLLHYLKMHQDGAISLFTAVTRRDSAGLPHTQLRIFPVLYHGARAASVFGSTPSQREFINEVIPAKAVATAPASPSGWRDLAYCYAALGGSGPASAGVSAPDEITPTVVQSPEGKPLEMTFSVLGPDRLLEDWRIEFDLHGQVKTIAFSTKPVVTPQRVLPAAPVASVKPAH
jgi:hypothetical protein